MTPAIRAIKKAGVSYKLHEYQHDPAASSYGEEAAFFGAKLKKKAKKVGGVLLKLV